ncbi:MAG: hypothetical protein ACYC96_16110 [Fimbriimonadaceae bacterium]
MPLISESLVTADELEQFAATSNVAAELLPELLRRLVLSSVAGFTDIRFNVGKAIYVKGWDGYVDCTGAKGFVPPGKSGWEVSVQNKPEAKASEDYAKRVQEIGSSERQVTSFVACTMRNWHGAKEWADGKNAAAPPDWLDVRAYGSQDLIVWLTEHQPTHIWLSQRLGKRPDGVTDIVTFWEDWNGGSTRPLTRRVMTFGYDKEEALLLDLLRGSEPVVKVQWESQDLATAFVAAVLANPSKVEDERLSVKAVYVASPAAFDQLVQQQKNLILVTSFEPEMLGKATSNGHKVVVPQGRDAIGTPSIMLRRRTPQILFEALNDWETEEDARRQFADAAAIKFQAFTRKFRILRPRTKWSIPESVPFALIDSWDNKYVGDRAAVSKLVGLPYDDAEKRATELSRAPDELLRQSAAEFGVVDEDAWLYLSGFVDDQYLTKFEEVCIEAFGEVDPQYDSGPTDEGIDLAMFPDRRGKLSHSLRLRSGLAKTICYLGVMGESINEQGTRRGDVVARIIVRGLFVQADTWQAFCSIAPWFSQFAEASPEEFLAALESTIKKNPDLIKSLFRDDSKAGFFFRGDSPHVQLLWALEALAWSPEFLSRAAAALARIAEIDPGGSLGNRPDASLTKIFLPWLPGTMGTVPERLTVLERIGKVAPVVFWKLLLSLLPEAHTVASRSSEPRLRPWGHLWQDGLTNRDVWEATNDALMLAIKSAGMDGGRWATLVDYLPRLAETQFEAFEHTCRDAMSKARPEERDKVYEALRNLVADHEAHPNSGWAMAEARMTRVRTLRDGCASSDSLRAQEWVFGDRAIFQLGPGDDFGAKDRKLAGLRQDLAAAVLLDRGVTGLIEFADRLEQPWLVGLALGQSDASFAERDLISEARSASENGELLALGVAAGRAAANPEWLWDLIKSEIEQKAPQGWIARLATLARVDERFAKEFQELPPAIAQAFWTRFGNRAVLIQDKKYSSWAIEQLLFHRMFASAITTLDYATMGDGEKPSAELAARVLEQATTPEAGATVSWGAVAHDVGRILDFISASGEVEPARVARLEFIFAELLTMIRRPAAINNLMIEDPSLFVLMLRSVYKPQEGLVESSPSDDDLPPPTLSHRLLDDLRTLPGSTPGGQVDVEVLRSWVASGRKLAAAAAREMMFDIRLGEWFAHSPRGADGGFPHEAVRTIIDDLESSELENGFVIGVLNSRGVTTRHMGEGGDQERTLAASYDSDAEKAKVKWPRTAAALRVLRDSYLDQAKQEDSRAGIE